MTTDTDRSDAITFLEHQHRDIRALFEQVLDVSPAAKAETFQRLVRLLTVHETTEEMVVHPAVRSLRSGEAIVRQRLDEESEAKQMLFHLEKMGVEDAMFGPAFGAFRTAVEEHASREEADEFPLARSAGDVAALESLGRQLRMVEALAPTHPHPHVPDSAISNLVARPFLSIADRVRDALTRKRL